MQCVGSSGRMCVDLAGCTPAASAPRTPDEQLEKVVCIDKRWGEEDFVLPQLAVSAVRRTYAHAHNIRPDGERSHAPMLAMRL